MQAQNMPPPLNETLWYSRVPDGLKKSFGWLMATGQTIRWATQQIVLKDILDGDEIRPVLKNGRCLSAVDIGCGGGHYLIHMLAPLSQKAIGIEINRESLKMAQNRILKQGLSNRVQALYGSADDIPLPEASVDLLLCSEVLEHLPDPQKALQEIKRILRPGGRAILTIPIPPDPYPNPEHHGELTPPLLEVVLAHNGFAIVGRRTCMYIITRAAVWLTSVARFPLPLVPLCRFEQASSRFISWPRPYGFICVVATELQGVPLRLEGSYHFPRAGQC
jgi:SAM-dependent methyltransferase